MHIDWRSRVIDANVFPMMKVRELTRKDFLNTSGLLNGGLTGRKQKIAFIVPLVILASMYPIFNFLNNAIEDTRIAWYLGLATYWLIWGFIFPLFILGKEDIKSLVKPQKWNRKILILLAIPLVLAIGAKLIPGMGEYEKNGIVISTLIISTAFGNGFFEEILWRGTYTKLFPTNIFFRMIWPAIWFGIWHYIPVSMNNHELTGLIGMIIGPMMMGLYLSYLTNKTQTLWWSIVIHTIGGLIMVL